MNLFTSDFQIQYDLSGAAATELDARLSLLLTTREGTMPLDREFGIAMDFLDLPPETAKSLYTAEVTKKVAKFIPEVRVKEIQWSYGEAGASCAKVVMTSA